MGKKNTSATKAGKTVNPADQARKEARKRELKKNKKQRLAVREAVIKGKDPKKIIEELERLDQMEYSVTEAPPLTDGILAERRKRLHGNFSRCLSLYEKDEKDKYGELKRMLSAYYRRHEEVKRYYESVKRAQSVNVDNIPLPSAIPDEDGNDSSPLLPSSVSSAPETKQHSWEMYSDDLSDVGGKRPPGPPCYPPPTLSDDSDDEELLQKAEDVGDSDAESGSDTEIRTEDTVKDDDMVERTADDETGTFSNNPTGVNANALAGDPRPPFPPGPAFRNVPPPRLPPHSYGQARPGMPPVIPTGPFVNMRPPMRPPFMSAIGPMIRPPVVENTAYRPGIVMPPAVADPKAMIAARPQLRNTITEVTRLVPTAVKVKRQEPLKPKPRPAGFDSSELIPHRPSGSQQNKGSTDEAYEQFMKEMEGLL